MCSKSLLTINKLHFAYGKQPVFEGLSLALHANQLTGLLALNGQGKSTLLKLIAGVLPLSVSAVQYRLPDKRIGYMPERPLSFPELTVLDNIAYAARIHRLAETQLQQRVDEVIWQCRLQSVTGKLAGNLSKGFQQRLGLAMAIVHQPALLLLDEPTDGMDPEQLTEAWQLIAEQKTQAGILLSSHRLSEVAEHCDRVLIMHQGALCADLMLDDDAQRRLMKARIAHSTSAVSR